MSFKKNYFFFLLVHFFIIFTKNTCMCTDNALSNLREPKIAGKGNIVSDIWNGVKGITEKIPDPFHVKDIFEKIPDSIMNPLESVENITHTITDLDELQKHINEHTPDPKELIDNLNELVTTTATYVKNNITLNCFGLRVDPFANVIEKMFTQTTKAEDVRFYFFSRKQINNITLQADQKFTLKNAYFDIRRPTVLIVHGFMSSGREKWLSDMKDALLNLADVNVILVDWQKGSNTWNYYSAAVSTKIVGLQIARLFAQIRSQVKNTVGAPKVSKWGSLYFIGHSLGAHISGYASVIIRESQSNKKQRWIVSRITGLDPAQPCFITADSTLKLDAKDAPYIDVIHTNAKHLLLLGLGLPEKLGYVDFYPNGGAVQPGCLDIDLSLWGFMMLPKSVIQESICSHGRSYEFLTESIVNAVAKNCTFTGYKWDRKSKPVKIDKELCVKDGCPEMGIKSIRDFPNNNGVFYVSTRKTSPFCDPQLKL